MDSQELAPVVHGDLEISKGQTMSEEQVVRLLQRLKKLGNPESCRVPKYVHESSCWETIKEFMRV